MTGQFSEKDPQRCNHYARFFKNLTLGEANTIFWLLFVVVLILMCISSLQHHKSIALNDLEKRGSKAEITKHNLRVRRLRVHQLSIVSLCLVLALAATVLECFAAFNIEYCDGEDLMQLYWGFWSVLQVGSNIAILGVMLQFWIILGDHETPSWAVALGTPVLVFAALGFVLRAIGKQTWQRCRGKRVKEENLEPRATERKKHREKPDATERSMSHAETIVANTNATSRDGNVTTTFWTRDLNYLLHSVVNNEEENRQ